MGNTVFVRPDGSTFEIEAGSAEASVLEKAGYQTESADAFAARQTETGRDNYYTSTGERIKAGIEGLGSGVTLGLSDVMVRQLPGAADSAARREYNPGIRTGTEIVGTIAAALPTGGESLMARAAASTPAGLVARSATAAGNAVGSKVGGRIVEGGIWGGAGAFQQSNVTGDPLTVEAIVEGATLGGVLNVATGALGDRLGLMGTRAKERVAARTAKELDEAAVARQHARFDEPPPSWEEFRSVHTVEQKTLAKQNRQLDKAAADHEHFLNDELNDRLKSDVPKAINKVRSYYAPARSEVLDVDAAMPSFQSVAAEDTVSTVNARMIHGKGFHQPPGVGVDKVKMDKGRAAMAEGQQDPVTIAISPKGGYYVQDGRHRLAAAIEDDIPITVKWVKGSAGLDGAVSKKKTDAWEYVRGGPAPQAPLVTPSGEVSIPAGRRVSTTAEGRRVYEYNEIRKQPMSEETSDFLRDIEERKSRALKLWGGGRDVSKGTWSKHDPNIAPNREAALAELRAIKTEFEARFPQASAEFRPVPLKPPSPTPFESVDLPKSLLEFGRMNESQVARLKAAAERHPRVREALDRLMKDLDVAPSAGSQLSGAETLHGVLSSHRAALSRLEVTEAADVAKSGGILEFMRKTGKSAARYAAGREADRAVGYGWKGAILKSGVGAGLGYAMGGVEGGLLGAAMLSGRQGTRGRIRDTIGAKLEKGGRLVTKLGPVTSYFSARWPDGERDPEPDVRKRTVNRINDVLIAAQTAPDAMFYAVEGMMGDESDVAWKLHAKVNGDLQYLAAAAPKDPGLDISLTGSRWTPSHQQVVQFAHVFEAVTEPLKAIHRALAVDGHPAAATALWERYPGLMSELATEFMARAPEMKIKYEHGGAFRDLFRVPITGLQQPVVAATLQGLYLPKPEATQGGQAAPRGPSAGGRPPAIQSPVAGSSVAALTQ